jgi:uncharacterized protein (TIGR02284 family)
MRNYKVIEVLNKLLEINNNRLEGYETALNETEDHDIKTLFAQLARTSHWNRKELAAEIINLGGSPPEKPGSGDNSFSVWRDLKTTLPELERETIIIACEVIEDRALEEYQEIIDNEMDNLNSRQKAMIQSQLALLQDDYNVIHSWRDSVFRLDEQTTGRTGC